MPDTKHLIIGGICLPLDVEALEALPIDPGGVFHFDFVYRDIRFAVRYEECADCGLLRVVGDVGPMPFSAESPDARAGLRRIMEHANEGLTAQFRLSQGRVALGVDTRLERPVTATRLISNVTLLLIPAAAYLDVISIYLRPPLAQAKPGESALRREWRRKPSRPAPAALPAPA